MILSFPIRSIVWALFDASANSYISIYGVREFSSQKEALAKLSCYGMEKRIEVRPRKVFTYKDIMTEDV